MAERSVQLARLASHVGDPTAGLAAVVDLRREVEALEDLQVREALSQGWSWSRIAGALGVSKQAAHRKHATPGRPAAPKPPADHQRLLITGQARRVVEYAREEAAALGHGAVQPRHLLLGLLRDQQGPAVEALEQAGVSLAHARSEVRASQDPAGDSPAEGPSPSRPPVSPRVRTHFEQSLREAVARGDDHLGVEHLLLALLRGEDHEAPRVLARLGVTAARVFRLLEAAVKRDGSEAETVPLAQP